jgi:uncharacterized protein YbaA (DUF1428 family)
MAEEKTLWAKSLFGMNTRRGIVELSFGETIVQCSSDEARSFALSVIEAAEAAETDEFIFHWLERRIGVKGDAEKASVLKDFREQREKHRAGEKVDERRTD